MGNSVATACGGIAVLSIDGSDSHRGCGSRLCRWSWARLNSPRPKTLWHPSAIPATRRPSSRSC